MPDRGVARSSCEGGDTGKVVFPTFSQASTYFFERASCVYTVCPTYAMASSFCAFCGSIDSGPLGLVPRGNQGCGRVDVTTSRRSEFGDNILLRISKWRIRISTTDGGNRLLSAAANLQELVFAIGDPTRRPSAFLRNTGTLQRR